MAIAPFTSVVTMSLKNGLNFIVTFLHILKIVYVSFALIAPRKEEGHVPIASADVKKTTSGVCREQKAS